MTASAGNGLCEGQKRVRNRQATGFAAPQSTFTF